MNRQPIFSDRTFLQVAIILMLGALWFYLEPYHGFYHDGRLYSMLAMYRNTPENFRHDLFVAYGSQDAFTIFSPLYAWLIRHAGLDTAAYILTGAGQLLWLGALLVLLQRVARGWPAVLAMACVVYFSRYYDGYGMFSYAEPYPTPRIYAEAFSLLGFALLLGRQYVWTLGCLFVACIFHPLMAAYGLAMMAVAFLADARFSLRLRGGLLAAAVLAGILLAWFRVGPFAGFLHPFDAQWLQVFAAKSRTSVFVWLWKMPAVLHIAYLLLILGIARWRRLPVLGERAPLIAGTALGLLLVWAVATLGWNDQLITQLQFWRCVWLLQILALMAQGMLLVDLWQSGGADRWLAGFMLAALLQIGFYVPHGTFAFCMVAGGLVLRYLLQRVPARVLERSPWNILPLMLAIPQLTVNALRTWDMRHAAVMATTAGDVTDFLAWCVAGGGVAAGFWLGVGRRRLGMDARALAWSTLGVATLTGGMFLWSHTYLQNAGKSPDPAQTALIERLQAYIPADAVVYSNNGLLWSWFLLHRSYYVDIQQTANEVFNREVAIEGFRRLLYQCQAMVPGCPATNFKDDSNEHPDAFWAAHAPRLCKDSALDFLVLRGVRMPGAEVFHVGKEPPYSVVRCHPYLGRP